MTSAVPMIISDKNFKQIFGFAETNSALAKNLYNAALFRIRQVLTGWDKAERSDNEKEVFKEIEITKETYKNFSYRKVLKYNALEKILRANKNPDFFSGLPMQTAQAVVRQAADDFQNWLKALKAYKENPSSFTGKPRMPKYCKSDRKTFVVTNQDAVLYPVTDKNGNTISSELKLPGFKKSERIPMEYIDHNSDLREMTFKPFYGRYIMTFVVENAGNHVNSDMPNMAGLDFGTDNIAAIACTDCSSVVYKGGAIMSENRLFAKCKASAVSDITRGHARMRAKSVRLENMSFHHTCFIKDQMHKISTDIIRFCIGHRVGTLVIGTNKGWKQNVNIGKKNNQNFVSIPHSQLKWMITYKALVAGINVVEQEESYTSKADITANDTIPVYGQEKFHPTFSGRRIERGLYFCSQRYCINADCNGAANILRKAFPEAWKNVHDFHFLATPECIGFHTLNPHVTAKSSIQKSSAQRKQPCRTNCGQMAA